MIGRRRFLVAAMGGAASASAAGFFLQKSSTQPQLREVRRSSYALGSRVSIFVLHDDHSAANNAIDAVFQELDLIESVMSLYRGGSEICALNATGELKAPHPYLVTVLHHAQHLAEESGGAFDVTVQPLWQLYSDCKKRGVLPSDSALAQAKSQIDFRKLRVAQNYIALEKSMQLTLNGIAQGFAVDRAMAVLRSHGIQHALLDTGEYGSIGFKENKERWNVGIQNPRKPDALSAVVQLDGRCLSTSGDYATTFSDDFSTNHIFDPRTGASPQAFSSVSVLAETGIDADALSTAVFVLGAERGMALLESHNADALVIRKDGSTLATPGFQKIMKSA